MLARYEDVAKAGKQIVLTDLPQEVLPLMVDLSLRVKDGNVRSIVFKNGVDGFVSASPDFVDMHKRVKIALGETKKTKKKKDSDSASVRSCEHGQRGHRRQLRVRPEGRGDQPATPLTSSGSAPDARQGLTAT